MASLFLKGALKEPRDDGAAYSIAVRQYDRREIKRILDKGWHDSVVIDRCFAIATNPFRCHPRFEPPEFSLLEFLKWLKDVSGADVNGVDARGRTALWFVCRNNDIDTAKWLIEQGADVNKVNGQGHSALMAAVARGNTEIARLLIGKGAEIGLKDEEGMTALDYALGEIDRAARRAEEIVWVPAEDFFKGEGD